VCSQIPFFNWVGSPFLTLFLFSEVRSQDKKEFFFYHAPYVVSHVRISVIIWDCAEPEAQAMLQTNFGTPCATAVVRRSEIRMKRRVCVPEFPCSTACD
jgi:hypothetical protein